MKITRIDAFQVTYNLLDHKYAWSRDRSVSSLVSTVVKVSTDDGINGFGEVCPLGSAYMAAFARAVPSGIAEIAPHLLGADPMQINRINGVMDLALGGHEYIKSPLDIACWDILGRAADMPVCTLLGGRQMEEFPLYRAISQGSPQEMADDVAKYRAEGYRRFQLKAGGDPNEDVLRVKSVLRVLQPGDILIADANTGWTTHQAIRVVNALRGDDLYIEQPCPSLDECLTVRNHTDLPFVLDEVITGMGPLLAVHEKKAADVVNLKISRLGGLSKARRVRDACESMGIAMTIEDSWGGDLATAAIAHLAASTRPDLYFTATDFNSYVDLKLAEDAPTRKNGLLAAPSGPGLGISVNEKLLGEPVVSVG